MLTTMKNQFRVGTMGNATTIESLM